jgi:hypothetical protein
MLDEVFRRLEDQLDAHVQASQGAVVSPTAPVTLKAVR